MAEITEFVDSPEEIDRKLDLLKRMVEDAKYLVVYTGLDTSQ